jgi:hypothetical protein
MRAATLFFCVSLTGAAILPVPQQYDPQTVQVSLNTCMHIFRDVYMYELIGINVFI